LFSLSLNTLALARTSLFLALMIPSMLSQPPQLGASPLLVAHRGASFDAPENTVASVKLAWVQWADAAEVDIHLTRDGQIVVIHDKSTKRTAGIDLQVATQDWSTLQSLEVGAWKSDAFKGEPLPLLKDVLAQVPAEKRLFIEIKCPSEVLPHLEKVVLASGLHPRQTVFIAFDWETITKTKRLFPDRDCFWLSGFKQDESSGRWQPQPEEVIQKALEAKVDGIDVYHGGPVDRAFVEAAHEQGLEVHTYTVNDPADARRLMEAGVDGITTDRPGFLREHLGLDDSGK